MMTTVSIDMVGPASDAGTTTVLGKVATSRLSEAAMSVNAATGRERGSDFQVASEGAISLFRKTLEKQAAENAALDETMRAALVSVSETLTKVDAAVDGETSTQVDAAAVGVQTTVNAAAGRDRGSDFQVASAATPAKPETLAQPEVIAQPSVSAVRSDAIGTIASTDAAASNVQLPALPQQIASNTALATDLTAATALVGEALTQVNVAAAEAQTAVDAAAGRDRGSDFQVASAEIPAETAEVAVSQLPALPQQIASNVTLETELTAATAAVSATLTALGDSGSAEAVSGASTEATRTSLPLSQPAAASEGEFSQYSTVNAAAAEAQTTVNAATGRERGSDFQVASAESSETPEVIDAPEASADALVAAGVVPQVTTPVTGVETPVVQVIASVDAVAAKAATPSADVLIQAASAVADTLLVSPGLLRGQGEVIVQLRPDVLEGTEVKISVIGRQLEVIFQPQTVDMAVLIENCRSQLTQHLAAKIVSFNVSVDVRKKRG